jgi:hypothetical protein
LGYSLLRREDENRRIPVNEPYESEHEETYPNLGNGVTTIHRAGTNS